MQVLYYRGVYHIYFYKTSNCVVLSVTCFCQERRPVTINIFITFPSIASNYVVVSVTCF